jgi:hypothetical protein
VTGHREKEVREKLGDLDRDRLLTLHQVRDQMKERTGAELLGQQEIDRRRLEVKQWRELERLDERLTHKEDMRDRFQQVRQEEGEKRQKRREARLGTTLYDRADLVSMQRDAMRELREKCAARDRAERQAQAHPRRETGAAKHQQTAYERLEARHARALSQRRTLPDVQAARDAGGVLFAVS